MSLHDLRGGRTQLNASTRFDASWTTEYQQHYSALNPWVKSGKIRPGLVAQGEELFPQEMLERTEYYNDFALKTDSVFTLGVALAVSGPTVFYLSVNRGLKQGTFESKNLLLMQSLLPHLQKAIEIHRRLAASRMFEGGVQLFPAGILVLDREWRVIECNAIAEEMVRGDGIAIRQGRLTASGTRKQNNLISFLADAFRTGGQQESRRVILHLPRPSGKPALSLVAIPAKVDFFLGVRRTLLLAVIDPALQFQDTEQKLARTYSLTVAESKLAAALLETKTLTKCSEALGISRNTAKTQLNAAFAKTCTSSLLELLRLLLCGPVMLSILNPNKIFHRARCSSAGR